MLRTVRPPINSLQQPGTFSLLLPSATSGASLARILLRSLFTTSSVRRAAPVASSSPAAAKTTVPPKATSNGSTILSSNGFDDQPLDTQADEASRVDWTKSFRGLSTEPFSKEAADILQAPIDPEDIEIKPDGIVYLPEIKYRRILNRAFGPGGWGLAPRGETIVTDKSVTREYALLAHGR